ncbi:MAG: hypothetical protein JST75_10270 [Bacteroidetes bacterium]|nr:hypothetical protein [Bacteroidota bacterium]
MLIRFKKYFYFLLLIICTSGTHTVLAQQEISISVHINRLPQGTYPTKLYQFSNTPGLVMVMITNHTGNAYTIYLNGTVTGDNGVTVTTAKGYQPASINLKAFETKTLNDIEAGSLFDPNSLVYISGSNSIKPSVFGEQGLPEGTYQVCVRAFDAATHKPLSDEDPIGCSNIFSVSTLEPPTILSPMDQDTIAITGLAQNIIFRWTTPPGAPPSTQYTIRLVEIFGGRNPNDAMQSTSVPFFETTVTGTPMFLYSALYPQLLAGRTYAMKITANDPSGGATFRNNGSSEVIEFEYGQLATTMMAMTIDSKGIVTCSDDCKMQIIDSKSKSNLSAIQVGSKLTIDGFDLTITKITSSNGGALTGEGKIQVPVLKLIPVSVSFQNIKINNSNQVISGNAVAKRRSDAASLLPDYDPTNPNITLDPAQAQNFPQYISNYITSNLNPQEAFGYSLPLGISNVSSSQITIAVTNMVFTPQQAYFDAGAAFEIPEEGMTVALGGRGICFSKEKTLCGQATIYLEKDFDLATTGIALKAADAGDLGTYIEFGADGFQSMRIRGEYSFSPALLQKKDGTPVKALLTVESTKSWADWIASVSIDAFHITGNTDFNFAPGSAFYDHSDKQNPAGMPADYTDGLVPTWRGFLIPSMQVELPALLKSFTGNNRLVGSAQSFIIDNQGLSGTLGIDNILPIDQGALDTWAYSVDRIEGVFKKNSFVQGNMKGRVILPIADETDPNSELDYTCTLSNNNGLQFQFVIQPKDNLNVPMWIVHMNIDKSSYIGVTVGGDVGFKATAKLTGNLSLNPTLPGGLGQVDIKAISFQNLTLNSSAPYISDGQLVTGQSSPEKFINGLPISFPESPKLSPDKLGLVFSLDVTLADIASIPKAHTSFSIVGGFDLVGGKLKARLPQVHVDEIGLEGWVGPVHVHGFVRFFDDNPQWGNGVDGVLQDATFPPGFSVKASALFGKKSFNYFFVGASFNLPPPGIPIGGGIVPLSIFGFGGGVYYNMTLNQEPMVTKYITSVDPMSMYKPAAGVTGFKGSVTLGTTDGNVFVGMGTLSVEIDQQTLALHKLAINIDAGLYTKLGEIESAMVRGDGFIQYDFSQNEFTAGINMNINLPGGFIKGNGMLGILTNFNTGDWYFKIGEPEPADHRVNLTLSTLGLLKFDFKTYQNVGNVLRLPASLQSIYDEVTGKIMSTDSYTDPVTQQTKTIPTVAGVLLGASAAADLNLEFLIFYLELKAGLGFDLALIKDARKCDNGDLLGLDGYYAFGDLYASGSFAFGLVVDVWFYKGKISVAEVGFKATLQAGFPNPFVFDGWLESDYSVLDGLISGHMNFHVKYSSADEGGCKLSANPFGGLPLVSAIFPGDGAANISIMSNINVAFNFPVNQEFSVTVKDDNTGKNVQKTLLVIVKKLSVSEVGGKAYTYTGYMNEDGSVYTEGGASIQAVYHNALLYGWQNAFDPSAKHLVKLTVYGFQRDANGNWQEVTESRIQDTTVSFMTGGCITRLDESVSMGLDILGHTIGGPAVCANYPFTNQRYFLPGQRAHGYIQLVRDIPCMQDPPASTGSNLRTAFQSTVVTGYDLFIQFISTKDNFEEPVTQQGKYLNFDIPQLSPATVYKLRIVKRPIYKKTGADLTQYIDQLRMGANSPLVTTRNQYLNDPSNGAKTNYVVLKNFAADATASLSKPDDIEIYDYFFRTSRFKTLQDKMGGAYQTGGVSWNLLMPFFQVSMLEGLDVYDANGCAYDGSGNGSNDWIIPPLVNLDEKYGDNPWMLGVIAPLVTNYKQMSQFDPMVSYNSLWELNSPSGNTSNTFTVNRAYVRGREPFMVTGYDPPLQSNEIPYVLLGNHSILTTPNLSAVKTSTQPSSPVKISATSVKIQP